MTDDDLEAIIVSAGSAYSDGRYLEALDLYEKAIVARPTNAILFANRAAIFLRLDRLQEALSSADRAIELDSTWAKAVVALSQGVSLDPSNNLIVDSLIEASQQLFKNFPMKRLESVGLEQDRFTILTMVGQELASAKHLSEASKVLTLALTLHSPSLRLRESALTALASVHYSLGEYHKATFCYEKQLELHAQMDGPLASIHDNIATTAELAGNYNLAMSHRKHRLKFLEGVDAMDERLKIAGLFCSLSQADAALEQYDTVDQLLGETSKCLEQLSTVSPTNEEDAVRVADSIVSCHIRDGNIQNAIEYLNNLLKRSSENNQQKLFGHTCFLLAREHIRNGRPTSAVRLTKRILRLARTTSDGCLEKAGLQLLATIHEEHNDLQSATALLQKYLEVDRVTLPEAVNALLKLSSLAKRSGADPISYLNKALKLADGSGNLDVVVLARSAMLRHLSTLREADSKSEIHHLLHSQRELLKSDISVSSRSLIFEDLAVCETAETSGIGEIHALEQSLTEAQEANNARRELFLLEKIGDCLLGMERYTEAEGFYQQLLTLAQQMRAVTQIKRAYMKLAILAAGFQKWSRCSELARRALTLSRFFYDHASKAHMMYLIGRAELSKGNDELARSILKKTVERCEEHGLNTTMALATRYIVEAAISCKEHNTIISERLRRHLELIDHETDQKAVLRTMIRLTKFSADLDHLTSLKIVAAVRKLVLNLSIYDQADVLLECFDVYHSLGMLDEARHLLIGMLDSPLQTHRDILQKVAERLAVFPLRRRVTVLLKLVEQGFFGRKILPQLAFFLPEFTLKMIPGGKDALTRMVCYVQMDEWVKALACAEVALVDPLPACALDGLFEKPTTEEAVQLLLLVAKWKTKHSLHWSNLPKLDDTTFCRLFDMAFSKILQGGIALPPKSRAHLHALMLHGEFELTHEAATAVEKIICAANTGCGEMIAMWYDELVEEYLSEQKQEIEIFPCSSTECQLKVASVFAALQHETLHEQLHVLEMCKWFMDKRLANIHGISLEASPPFVLPSNQSFAYVFRVGDVQLIWVKLRGCQAAISVTLRSRNLSFLEECLVRYLQRLAIPEALVDLSPFELIFVNDQVNLPVKPKLYRVHHFPSDHFEEDGDCCEFSGQFTNEKSTAVLSERLILFSQSTVAIMSAGDSILHPDICLSIRKTPFLVITLGSPTFDTIRALFLCGTSVVVEVDESTKDKDIRRLINAIDHSSDLLEVLSSYCCYIKSRETCFHWMHSSYQPRPPAFDCVLDLRGILDEIVEATESSSTATIKESISNFVEEIRHIDNLWLKPPHSR
uniref:TPR_REGION domain-containing protein n=1 Tax=Haemonchus contortus TaxID=6289 RepID=A0A7I4YBE9_HAECO